MQTLSFNTGRDYTPKGQRIAAALLDNGDIVFVDCDRRIHGTIPANGLTRDEILLFDQFNKKAIMADYDKNHYENNLSGNEEIVQQLRNIAESI